MIMPFDAVERETLRVNHNSGKLICRLTCRGCRDRTGGASAAMKVDVFGLRSGMLDQCQNVMNAVNEK